jgi:hypothetical protein
MPPAVTRCSSSVIASEAKQSSSFSVVTLDCFASLAMTRRDQCPCSGSVNPNVFVKSFTCSGDRYRGFNPRSSK